MNRITQPRPATREEEALIEGAQEAEDHFRLRELTEAETAIRWSDLFPGGRDIFYEGDKPEEFASEIKAEFGFDPAADPKWSELVDGEPMRLFHCPADHLDAIYGSGRFPMGS